MTTTDFPAQDITDGPTVQLPRPAVRPPAPAAYPAAPNHYPGQPGYPAPGGWGGMPPAGPFPPAGFPGAQPPRPSGLRNPAALALSAAAVVVIIALVIAVVATRGESGTPQRIPAKPGSTATAAPAPETVFTSAQLSGIALNVTEMASLVGQPGTETMADARPARTELYDDTISDQSCIGVAYPGEQTAYRGSGYRAVRTQFTVTRPSKGAPQLWILDQVAVAFPTTQAAADFVSNAAPRWQACGGKSWTQHVPALGGEPAVDYSWTTGAVSDSDGLLTAQTSQENGDGWGCRRGLKAYGTLVVDLGVCAANLSDSVVPQAIDAITAKAATL